MPATYFRRVGGCDRFGHLDTLGDAFTDVLIVDAARVEVSDGAQSYHCGLRYLDLIETYIQEVRRPSIMLPWTLRGHSDQSDRIYLSC